MGIKFLCTACNRKLNVKSFLAGKRGVCPHCNGSIRIPTESQPTDGAAVAGQAHEMPAEASIPTAMEAQPAAIPMQPSAIPAQPVASAAPVATVPAAAPVAIPAEAPSAAAAQPVQTAPSAPVPSTSSVAATPPPLEQRNGSDPIAESPNSVWYVRPPGGGQYGPARGDVMRKWIAEGRVSADSMVWREGWSDWQQAAPLFPGVQDPSATSTPAAARSSTTTYRRRNTGTLSAVIVILLLLAAMVALVVLAIVVSQ